MCASYWNLDTKIKCPKCKKISTWNLQTHFNGGEIGGMCMDYYKLKQKIVPLKGITMIMNRKNDWFIGDCPKCEEFFDFGANVESGMVKAIFVI